MRRSWMPDTYLVPGFRTPFAKAGTVFSRHTALELSASIAAAMNAKARPDFLVWGQAIPDPSLSNIARELIFQAKLDPEIPSFSDVMACSTSFVGTIFASGMVGRSDMHLALVGGVETMSHVPLALKMGMADKIIGNFLKNPAAAAELLAHITAGDFDLPI